MKGMLAGRRWAAVQVAVELAEDQDRCPALAPISSRPTTTYRQGIFAGRPEVRHSLRQPINVPQRSDCLFRQMNRGFRDVRAGYGERGELEALVSHKQLASDNVWISSPEPVSGRAIAHSGGSLLSCIQEHQTNWEDPEGR
jgi:hypothetical protein